MGRDFTARPKDQTRWISGPPQRTVAAWASEISVLRWFREVIYTAAPANLLIPMLLMNMLGRQTRLFQPSLPGLFTAEWFIGCAGLNSIGQILWGAIADAQNPHDFVVFRFWGLKPQTWKKGCGGALVLGVNAKAITA